MPDNDAVIAAPVAVPDAPKDVMSTSTIAVETPVVEVPKVVEPVIEPPVPEKPPKKDWVQERINEVVREKKTFEREAAQREAALIEQNAQLIVQLAAAKKGDPTFIPPVLDTLKPAVQPVHDIETLVNQRVELIQYNSECNRIAEDGKKEFTDFNDAIGNLVNVGLIELVDPMERNPKPLPFLQMTANLENPHKVLHYLGSNPDEAAKLRALDKVQLARELTKLEFKLNQPKSVSISNAPPPIKPINGVAKGEIDILNPPKDMSMEEWVAANRKRRQAARAARKW
jgi:hypothetical protein